MALTLDILIATHRPEGILRLADADFPKVPGVSYVVSWQNHKDFPIPDALLRPDMKIFRLDFPGLSRNRNNALAHCSSDIVLIADDDVEIDAQGMQSVIDTFSENPDVEVATFRSVHGDMSRFPDHTVDLNSNWPKGYYVSSIEIAFRRIPCSDLRFCPELGLGSRYLHGGEDEAFILSAIKRNHECRYFPVTICAHPHESSGNRRLMSAASMRAAGCYIALRWPATAFLRAPLKAWRIFSKRQASLPKALCHVIHGALMAHGVLRRNRDSLW